VARCDTYYKGECTWGACSIESWVQEGWGNANQWASRAQARGFTLTREPALHAIACFGPGGPYDPVYGHLGVVTEIASPTSYKVQEMNFAEWNKYDFRWTTLYYLGYFILKPGTAPPPPAPPPAPADPAPLDRLTNAWAYTQHYFNVDIEAHLSTVQLAQAQADALVNA
jgi:surface antigen